MRKKPSFESAVSELNKERGGLREEIKEMFVLLMKARPVSHIQMQTVCACLFVRMVLNGLGCGHIFGPVF
jgi:hypothetical protein